MLGVEIDTRYSEMMSFQAASFKLRSDASRTDRGSENDSSTELVSAQKGVNIHGNLHTTIIALER